METRLLNHLVCFHWQSVFQWFSVECDLKSVKFIFICVGYIEFDLNENKIKINEIKINKMKINK